jgi:hypothetical protein
MPEAATQAEPTKSKVDNVIPSEDEWASTPEERGDFFEASDEPMTQIDLPIDTPEPIPEVAVEEEVQAEEQEQEPIPEVAVEEGEEIEQAEEKPTQPHMIPKARLDTQIAKTRDLEHDNIRMQEQLRIVQEQMNQIQIQKGTQNPPTAPEPEAEKFDYASHIDQMNEAILDGEKDQAASALQTILSEQRKDIESNIMQNVEQTLGQNARETQVQQELSKVTTQLEQDYPQFNPENTTVYDQEVVDNVNRLMAAYTHMTDNQGYAMYTPATALQEAVNILVGQPGKANAEAEPAQDTPKDLSKKIKASNKQPPELRGDSAASHGSEKTMDVYSMPEDEFDALPASTIRKLRGDA